MFKMFKIFIILTFLTNICVADELKEATVRIWRLNSKYYKQSSASGTIIGQEKNEAIILTCAHLYDNSEKDDVYAVDFFYKDFGQNILAIPFASNRLQDVALMKVKIKKEIPYKKVASGYFIEDKGVIAAGCELGADVELFPTKIIEYDKFHNFRSVTIVGKPVSGRSGGGLFNSKKRVIGTCRSTGVDYTPGYGSNTGIYSNVPAIHKLLDENKLSHLYQD